MGFVGSYIFSLESKVTWFGGNGVLVSCSLVDFKSLKVTHVKDHYKQFLLSLVTIPEASKFHESLFPQRKTPLLCSESFYTEEFMFIFIFFLTLSTLKNTQSSEPKLLLLMLDYCLSIQLWKSYQVTLHTRLES